MHCIVSSCMRRATRLLAALVLFTVVAAPATAQNTPFGRLSYEQLRNRMVDEDIVKAGVKDPRVISAARATERHEFVAPGQREMAYFDMALPIGEGQTISPPFIVAYMTEQLEPQPTDVVLEIGTGSGYQAAMLSPLVKDVYTIEIQEPLGRRAARTLKRLKYKNVHTRIGDGYKGWPEAAPFDKIIVTCSPENVPQPLVDQLREGGRLLVPLGERYKQTLYLFTKKDGKLEQEALLPTLFVPMTGAAEEQRQVLPDPANPTFANGSFEESVGEPLGAVGWHYQRQSELIADKSAPDGKQFIRFANSVPGRNSAALQGMGVDGREVHEINVLAWVRANNVRNGPQRAAAGLALVFYDEVRNPIAEVEMGPWVGSFEWKEQSKRFAVPPNAREAICRVGLLGATGELDVDGLRIVVAKRAKDAK
ncbi:MAG: protein-L-isoaspartate(D-aspartate) O-methyltransferase [Pirellulales bacterium]